MVARGWLDKFVVQNYSASCAAANGHLCRMQLQSEVAMRTATPIAPTLTALALAVTRPAPARAERPELAFLPLGSSTRTRT